MGGTPTLPGPDLAGPDLADPDLVEPDLVEEVHSVAYWFDAVADHLRRGLAAVSDREGGDAATEGTDRLLTVLANYALGELTALEGAGGLVELAGDRRAKTFLATQTLDEARHLEVFTRRMRSLGVDDPDAEMERRAHPALQAFRERLLGLVHDGDWESAVFAQNVVLESMERAVFDAHRLDADLRTRVVLDGVIADERRHLGFGENQLGRRLAAGDERLARRLSELRAELDPLVMGAVEGVAAEIGLAPDRVARLRDDYEAAVHRLGLS
ncbi:MAG: long-chain fatty aldehyde decarbonylase [Actinomyces sp.]|nr:MAG: long-chain fatty aldehyde decarbonylase [Actinomyces sp.]